MDVAPCWMELDLSFWLTEYYPSRFEYLIGLGVGDDIASEKQTHDWRKGEKEQSQSWRCAHLMSCGKKIWIFSFACYTDKNQLLVVICTCWFVPNSIFSCPGSSIPDLGVFVFVVAECHFRILTQRVTFETWDPSDIWSEW